MSFQICLFFFGSLAIFSLPRLIIGEVEEGLAVNEVQVE
jgi:hypothetical protein